MRKERKELVGKTGRYDLLEQGLKQQLGNFTVPTEQLKFAINVRGGYSAKKMPAIVSVMIVDQPEGDSPSFDYYSPADFTLRGQPMRRSKPIVRNARRFLLDQKLQEIF